MGYRYETTLSDGKISRNGKVYPSELYAKCNEAAPIPVRYCDKVVGEIQHIRNDGDCAVAVMSLDKGALEKLQVSPIALGFRGTAEISEDGVYHELDVKSVDFVARGVDGQT